MVFALRSAPRIREGVLEGARRLSLPSLLVFAISAVFILINLRWVWIYRHGRVLDIDEAGYLGIAVSDYWAYVNGGIKGWLSAVNASGSAAPILPALASIFFIVFGPDPVLGFAASITCIAVLIVVTFYIGQEVMSARAGLIAAVLVATTPSFINFSRAFEFIPAASLAAALALLCLFKSDRMRNARWAILFSFAVAMMPLSRTMTLGFIPGLIIGAAVYVAIDPVDRTKRCLLLVLSVALAVAIASIWFIPNGQYVFPYLLNYGYGSRATEYGPAGASVFSFATWTLIFQQLGWEIKLAHFAVIAIGVALTAFAFIRDAVRSRSIMPLAASPLVPVVTFVGAGFAALASTSNRGFGFAEPLIPPLIILASVGLARVKGYYRRPAIAGLVACAGVWGAVPFVDPQFSSSRVYHVPFWGDVALFDGRSYVEMYGATVGKPPTKKESRAWRKLSEDIAFKYKDANAVAFGMRHIFFNTNTLTLDQRLKGYQTANYQFDAWGKREQLEDYQAWLHTPPVSDACILLTSDSRDGDFVNPGIDNNIMAAAAEREGFQKQDSYPMPNGNTLTAWKRSTLTCR